MIKELCAKCGDSVGVHALYGCCGEPLESSLSCGNEYRKCAECTGAVAV
jgi:hypothetical protein